MTSAPFILERIFDAPRNLVWEAMTQAEHLMHWFGPTGTLDYATVELRQGGVFLYGIAAGGAVLRAKRTFTEIEPQQLFVTIAAYCDEAQNITRHPFAPTWPLEMRIATTLTEQGGKTHMLLDWSAHNATAEEQATFDAGHAMLKQGWDRAFDNLDARLRAMQGTA